MTLQSWNGGLGALEHIQSSIHFFIGCLPFAAPYVYVLFMPPFHMRWLFSLLICATFRLFRVSAGHVEQKRVNKARRVCGQKLFALSVAVSVKMAPASQVMGPRPDANRQKCTHHRASWHDVHAPQRRVQNVTSHFAHERREVATCHRQSFDLHLMKRAVGPPWPSPQLLVAINTRCRC